MSKSKEIGIRFSSVNLKFEMFYDSGILASNLINFATFVLIIFVLICKQFCLFCNFLFRICLFERIFLWHIKSSVRKKGSIPCTKLSSLIKFICYSKNFLLGNFSYIFYYKPIQKNEAQKITKSFLKVIIDYFYYSSTFLRWKLPICDMHFF